MFGSTWPHHLKIEGVTSSISQSDDGEFSSGSQGAAIYEGKCDAQDSSKGYYLADTADGTKEKTAELEIFLKDESNISDIDIGMVGELTRFKEPERINVVHVEVLSGLLLANTI